MSTKSDFVYLGALFQMLADECGQSGTAQLPYSLEKVAAQVVTTCCTDGGRVVITGMGKAGHIGRKFAATLSSIGFPAVFMHPGEAAHGDLGMLAPCDFLIAISNSGRTIEVQTAVKHALELDDAIPLAVISQNPSFIVGADFHVKLPDIRELDPDGLVPTASMVVLLALCDQIALIAQRMMGFGSKEFGRRHHGGYLGQLTAQARL